MRKAKVFVSGKEAGQLEEVTRGSEYVFRYLDDYRGNPVSLSMPVQRREFRYDRFPPFFDGVLPEGVMLDGLLRQQKIDKDDLFSQLIAVGKDMVGAVTVEELR